MITSEIDYLIGSVSILVQPSGLATSSSVHYSSRWIWLSQEGNATILVKVGVGLSSFIRPSGQISETFTIS